MMDNDFTIDVDRVLGKIDDAEVLSVFFPTFRKALVVDTRSSDSEDPMVRIMPMAASTPERLRSIRRLRPSFPRPVNLTVIPWPRYVDSLVELGIWERILDRVGALTRLHVGAACHEILEELRRLEKGELAGVVIGENYHTIWSARN